MEDVSVSGDQFALNIFDVCQCAKAVNLEFKDVLIGVERLGAA